MMPRQNNFEQMSQHKECSGRGSNPYAHFWARDFKSLLSTNSNTRAIQYRSKSGTFSIRILQIYYFLQLFCTLAQNLKQRSLWKRRNS